MTDLGLEVESGGDPPEGLLIELIIDMDSASVMNVCRKDGRIGLILL